MKTCSIDNCSARHYARGWCQKHYVRWQRHGDPHISSRNVTKTKVHRHDQQCIVPNCTKSRHVRSLCTTHYDRWLRYKDVDPSALTRKPPTGRRKTPDGYMILKQPDHPNAWCNGFVLEHYVVMAEHIGRPINPHERVHHKNGVRHDNRIDNLELWTHHHPTGQRVIDLLDWAHQILAEYDGLEEILRDLS